MALPKGQYEPQIEEPGILSFWLENKFYAPEYTSSKKLSTASQAKRESYTIILPPPNANGNLHLGHMSGYAYQDIMGRYNRMRGKKVLLLPGKDHAGIQTEVVFESELEKQGKKKQDIGREKFYELCYEFCMQNSATARSQEQKIGLSADFDRELFTLDPRIVDEVLNAFVLMYKDHLIYRGKRLINWCVRCKSALADIDTEFKDAETKFFYFKYGFTTPDPELVALKHEFAHKSIEWKYLQSENRQGEKTPFAIGEYPDFKVNGDTLKIFAIGDSEYTKGKKYKSNAIGVLSKLNGNHRLITVPEDFSGDIKKELERVFYFEIKRAAGAHIILFDEYPDDKFYTKGFIIGTVRPETKFGDTALAVDPSDERFKDFVGKEFEVITLNGVAKMKLIADHAVKKEEGTGILKVTPAHAMEDWDIAQRHPAECMPEKQVINFDGRLNHLTGKYEGMTVKEARAAMIPDMKATGILVHLDETYKNRIRICERCKHPIEPLISYQWFVNTKPLKNKAKELVEKGFTEIMPDGKKKTYMDWMNTPEDWCITRQLWWGYRVPVWYKDQPSEYISESGEVKEKIGDKIMDSLEDYAGFMHVGEQPPGIHLTAIRHAESEGNVKGVISGQIDHKLTENGIQQAEALANSFQTGEFDIIISSALSRAKNTADILAKKIGCEVITSNLIDERNFGDISGLTDAEIAAKYPEMGAVFQEDVPNGESIPEAETRIKEFIKWVKTEHSDKKNVLIVTHTGPLRIFYRELGGMTYAESRAFDIPNLFKAEFTIPEDGWVQDEDVLDTWFSSGQWPYVTLKANADDFEQFYPTQVMETGWDILLFWVTRMMLLNPYRAKNAGLAKPEQQIPFKDVYLHGLVLDKNGVKMSKSKGNGIDPFEMMQKYGTDALRFSFVIGNAPGQNYRLYEEKIASYRNFCNKIWNASKFVLMNLEDAEKELTELKQESLELSQEDLNFIEHLQRLAADTTRRMDSFQFGVAAQELYDSFWHEFADRYIETIKTRLYTKDREGNPINTSAQDKASRLAAQWTIYTALSTYLKLLHPFIPFITERIWQELPKANEEAETIMYTQWPGQL